MRADSTAGWQEVQCGGLRLTWVRGIPFAGVGDPILYLSRQPTAALTPAFPLASEAAPRTLNV